MGPDEIRKPRWLKARVPGGKNAASVRRIIEHYNLSTVCTEARCPNRGECFELGTATFLILGKTCTRHCLYCAVTSGKPSLPENDEPSRVAIAVKNLNLKHAVITSVTRDDLDDGGVKHFVETVTEVRTICPEVSVEILLPDLRGTKKSDIISVFSSRPDVFAHNIEVVRALFPRLRPQGNYDDSLSLIQQAGAAGLMTKSGLMVGFGESRDEIVKTLEDLSDAGCRAVVIGQYIRPRADLVPVMHYYSPEDFMSLAEIASDIGFMSVESGPMVRSSYHAKKIIAGEKS